MSLFSGGVVGKLAEPIIDHLFPDQEAATEAKLRMLELEKQGELAEMEAMVRLNLAQVEVNKSDSEKGGFFQSGWRPFVGWVCGGVFAYHFLVQPFLIFVLSAVGVSVMIPDVDIEMILAILGYLLGYGGYRTLEKWKGVR